VQQKLLKVKTFPFFPLAFRSTRLLSFVRRISRVKSLLFWVWIIKVKNLAFVDVQIAGLFMIAVGNLRDKIGADQDADYQNRFLYIRLGETPTIAFRRPWGRCPDGFLSRLL